MITPVESPAATSLAVTALPKLTGATPVTLKVPVPKLMDELATKPCTPLAMVKVVPEADTAPRPAEELVSLLVKVAVAKLLSFKPPVRSPDTSAALLSLIEIRTVLVVALVFLA